MSEAKLDQLVKGTPSPAVEHTLPSNASVASSNLTSASNDPLASLPSSPPQIYLNLLILEASLRAQYLELRARRRQYTFFLTLLGLWIVYFGYALFLAPREDGSGVGGSVYWVVEVTQKVAFMGGIVTGILVWGTGQWERGIRWPRRWLAVTNRGLRGFNVKLVIIKRPWWRELLSTLAFFISYGLFSSGTSSSYRYVDPLLMNEVDREYSGKAGSRSMPHIQEDDETRGHEEDLAPAGDHIKLLLLPKPFSPSFRENWDIYRSEYWDKENERRAILRTKIKLRERQLAKRQGGWLWWTGWRGWDRGKPTDIEKRHPHRHIHHGHAHSQGSISEKRPRSGSIRAGTGSRSSTPSSERRRAISSVSEPRWTRKSTPTSGTPEPPSSLKKEISRSSMDSERSLAGSELSRSTRSQAAAEKKRRGSSVALD